MWRAYTFKKLKQQYYLYNFVAPLRSYDFIANLIILSQIELLLRKNNVSLPSKTMNIMYENLKNKGNNFIILS